MALINNTAFKRASLLNLPSHTTEERKGKIIWHTVLQWSRKAGHFMWTLHLNKWCWMLTGSIVWVVYYKEVPGTLASFWTCCHFACVWKQPGNIATTPVLASRGWDRIASSGIENTWWFGGYLLGKLTFVMQFTLQSNHFVQGNLSLGLGGSALQPESPRTAAGSKPGSKRSWTAGA